MTLALEPTDLAELIGALAPMRSAFDTIKVFGSRATGRSQRTSDLDLVVYGADRRTMRAIVEALEDSLLPMTADVVSYETIRSQLLREHIDRVAIPLPFISNLLDTQASAAAE